MPPPPVPHQLGPSDIPEIAEPPHPATLHNEDEPPGGSPREDPLIREQVETQRANRTLRQRYADKAHQLALGCIAFWIITIGAVGVVNAVTGRQILSDTVLVAVTTGVTVNVLAAFIGVIRGLFPATDK